MGPNMHAATQVAENHELLHTMLDDLRRAPAAFQPTNYWTVYERRFLPELEKYGLHDFRRRRGSVLSSFGATDLRPRGAYVDLVRCRLFANRITKHLPGWSRLLGAASRFLNRPGYQPAALDIYDCSLADLRHSAYRMARVVGDHVGARPLGELDCSLAGNPEDFFEVDGHVYTMRALYYYMRYAYCCQFLDFSRVQVVVELGSGSGKQIEVIRKLHPEVCVLAFDIPPQLYVCEQYLSSVFPESVVSYATTRSLTDDQLRASDLLSPGRILILGADRFPLVESMDVDLFWVASSFQDMEPDIVANYLKHVNEGAQAVYIQAQLGGKTIAPRPLEFGVLRETTLDDFRRGLASFELANLSPSLVPLGELENYFDSFWERESSAKARPDHALGPRYARV